MLGGGVGRSIILLELKVAYYACFIDRDLTYVVLWELFNEGVEILGVWPILSDISLLFFCLRF